MLTWRVWEPLRVPSGKKYTVTLWPLSANGTVSLVASSLRAFRNYDNDWLSHRWGTWFLSVSLCTYKKHVSIFVSRYIETRFRRRIFGVCPASHVAIHVVFVDGTCLQNAFIPMHRGKKGLAQFVLPGSLAEARGYHFPNNLCNKRPSKGRSNNNRAPLDITMLIQLEHN